MNSSKKQGQKSKPLRTHEDNAHPTKKRRVVPASEKRAALLKRMLQQNNNNNKNTPAATSTPTKKVQNNNNTNRINTSNDSSSDGSSDDEDNIPLTQRRALKQPTPSPIKDDVQPIATNKLESPLRRMKIAQSPIPQKPMLMRPQNLPPSPQLKKFPSDSMEIDKSPQLKPSATKRKTVPRIRNQTPELSIPKEQRQEKDQDSFEKRGEVTLEKLTSFVDIILDKLDHLEDNDSNKKYEILTQDEPPLLQPSIMQKFTSLVLKAVHFQVIKKMDLSKLSQIIRSMEQHCLQAMELEVIPEYSKARERGAGYDAILKSLDRIVNGLEAAAMVVDIYAVCKIDKQYLPESLVLTCMQFIRSQLDNTIYPLIDLNGFEEDVTSLNNDARAFLRFVESTPTAKNLVSRMLRLVTHFFRHVSHLLSTEGLDDHGIIILCYIAMGTFFHDYTENNHSCLVESPGAGDTMINPFEQMKMASLDVLRLLFNRYPNHRKWILSEILTSLNLLTTMDRTVKRYRLRDNTRIHVMSALLMQLVQCCTITGDIEDHRQWIRKWEIKYQKAKKEDDSAQIQELQQKIAQKTAPFWKAGVAAATESATYLLEYLVSKCKSRKRDSYSVAEYRAILESTMHDVLLVLGKPEWPAAELLLQVFSLILTSKLHSKKSDLYLKSMAIDWLGIIASKIKTSINRVSGQNTTLTPKWVCELHEILPFDVNRETSPHIIDLLHRCHLKIYDYFDQSNVTALQFHTCSWGSSYTSCWSKSTQKDDEWGTEIQDALRVNMARTYYLSVMNSRYPDELVPESTSFEIPELNWTEFDLLSELLASRNILYKSFSTFLAEIMDCFHSEIATYRTKAVRAIRHIATDVPEILDEARIRVPIIQRIHDSSPSVRDSTVEVLSRYLGRQTDVPRKLYDVVSTRVMDTAISVRKRVIKLLRELYYKCSDEEVKVDIASKLILRISDSEVGISELALKMSQEVLFTPFHDVDQDENDYFGTSYNNASKARKVRIKKLTKTITDAVARMEGGKATALTQIVQKTIDTNNEKSRMWFEKIFQWIIDCLFDTMMVHDEAGEMEQFKNCLVTIHSFAKVCPDLLRETQLTSLQPYLSVSEQDDWPLARYILNIYEDVLPRMKYHDPDLIAMIERVLIQLVGSSPLDVTPSTISCLCAIIDRISHRYGILVRILGSCIVKLRGIKKIIQEKKVLDRPATNVTKLLIICGLLCQHFDFDKKRKEDPEKIKGLEKISQGTIESSVFELLFWYSDKHLYTDNTLVRLAAIQGLGYFFMRYPSWITSEQCLDLMDDTFEHGSVIMQTRLMKVYHEFLSSEENRLAKNEEEAGASLYTKEIDVDILLGNTADFAELGVNGSLMQRYLKRILECSISESNELRYAAYEVISVIMHQGLAHPVLCMPAIFAAQTSPDSGLRHKAYYLHRYAHDKYGALLYTHFPQYFAKAYQYQKLQSEYATYGFRAGGGDTKHDALFSLAFSVIKQKKKPKMDFLVALLKPFKFDLKDTTADDVDVYYLRFLADNIITLDLTQSDEVLHLLYHINRIQATSCADLVAYIQFIKKNRFGNDTIDHAAVKSAIAMYILLRIKSSLKDLYGISDSDIAVFDPNEHEKVRALTKHVETDFIVEWHEELQYFQDNQLNETTAMNAYDQFELLAMTATTEGEDDDQQNE